MLSDEVGDAEFIISTSFTRHYWKSIERHDQALLHISRHLARRGGLPQADRTPGEPAGVAAAASVGVKSTMRPGNRKPSGRQGSVSRRLLDHGARWLIKKAFPDRITSRKGALWYHNSDLMSRTCNHYLWSTTFSDARCYIAWGGLENLLHLSFHRQACRISTRQPNYRLNPISDKSSTRSAL